LYTRFLFVVVMFVSPELFAQSSDTGFTTRADQIQQQRKQKAANARANGSSKMEKQFARMASLIRRMPVRFGVAQMPPGAGLAIGSALEWNSSGNLVGAKLWGIGSVHYFYNVGTGVELRTLSTRDLRFSLEGMHMDAPRLEYYGSGPDSSIHNRTNYRREDTFFNFRVELRSHRRVSEACRIGELLLNVGPGTNDSLASTESLFGPAEAPGIDTQSNYLIAGCSAEVDFLDFSEDPHKGTHAVVSYDRNHAQNDDSFSFHRLSAAAEHYVPFLNKKRVIAIRGLTELSFHSNDQAVPFYLQATLGGPNTLRGFRRYRFYDENAIAFTAEYRWEINTGFDMALFADFGKVFNRPGEISLAGMETSGGFGFRFKYRRKVVARLDTGFSHEGFQVWLKFGKPF